MGVIKQATLVHQPAHMSSYLPIGWPSPMSPKYMAAPMSSLSNARFIPHIGKRVPLGIVRTASTYLWRQTDNNSTLSNSQRLDFYQETRATIQPSVALARLDKLGWGVIVRDVEPEPMGDSSLRSFPHAERVAADKVRTLSVGVVQCVEEEWCGWSQQVINVLSQRIDLFPTWILGYLYIHPF